MRTYRRPTAVQLQTAVSEFNEKCAIGGRVSVRLDGGQTVETTTLSLAQVLSGHSAVVWLDGVSGCYDLDCVDILPPEAEATDAPGVDAGQCPHTNTSSTYEDGGVTTFLCLACDGVRVEDPNESAA